MVVSPGKFPGKIEGDCNTKNYFVGGNDLVCGGRFTGAGDPRGRSIRQLLLPPLRCEQRSESKRSECLRRGQFQSLARPFRGYRRVTQKRKGRPPLYLNPYCTDPGS